MDVIFHAVTSDSLQPLNIFEQISRYYCLHLANYNTLVCHGRFSAQSGPECVT